MSLRTTLESHPLPILAAAVVASGAVVQGVTQYFHSREMIQKPHELDDLRSRIASINRRTEDEPLFLDVLSVQIERSEVSSLPTRYIRFDDEIAFFVDVPTDESWRNSRISLDDTEQIVYGIDTTSNPHLNHELRAERNIVAWPFLEDRNQNIDADSDPDLGRDRVLGGPQEPLNTEMQDHPRMIPTPRADPFRLLCWSRCGVTPLSAYSGLDDEAQHPAHLSFEEAINCPWMLESLVPMQRFSIPLLVAIIVSYGPIRLDAKTIVVRAGWKETSAMLAQPDFRPRLRIQLKSNKKMNGAVSRNNYRRTKA